MQIKVQCSSCGSWFRAEDRLIGKRVKCSKCGNIFNAQDSGSATCDAFISYASEDAPTADLVCSELEREGLRCWIAPRDILPGAEYGASIVAAIHRSRSLVLVFSSHANRSPQVRREVERAASKDIPIVPLRIENVVPSEALEYFISSHHWMDALTPPFEPHIRRLAVKLRQMLSARTKSASTSPPPPTPGHGPAGASSPNPVQELAGSEVSVEPPYEESHRLAFTMGDTGYWLICLKGGFSQLFQQDLAQYAWPPFEYVCRQLGVQSGLHDYLRSVQVLAPDECEAVAQRHIIAPLSPLAARDGRYNAFARLGMCRAELNVYLQMEAQGVPFVRPRCAKLLADLVAWTDQARLPLNVLHRVRAMQETHARSTDPANLGALPRELTETVYEPLNVTLPTAGGGAAG
jgi:predicted Zn finger-like uncharacterized protein